MAQRVQKAQEEEPQMVTETLMVLAGSLLVALLDLAKEVILPSDRHSKKRD